jgi:hypothetical protein
MGLRCPLLGIANELGERRPLRYGTAIQPRNLGNRVTAQTPQFFRLLLDSG